MTKLLAKEKKRKVCFRRENLSLGERWHSLVGQITSLVLIRKFHTDWFEVTFLGKAEISLGLLSWRQGISPWACFSFCFKHPVGLFFLSDSVVISFIHSAICLRTGCVSVTEQKLGIKEWANRCRSPLFSWHLKC